MLRIAVVDDDKDFVSMYSDMILRLFNNNNVDLNIRTCNCGNSFIRDLAKIKYDLVFMDIDMPDISGIDIAATLRKYDQDSDIIFVSAHPHFVFEAIRFTPYRFIRKTSLNTDTIEAIQSYCNRTQNKYKLFPLNMQNCKVVNERIKDIRYFFAIRHDIYCVVGDDKNGKCLSRKYSLTELQKTIGPFGFIRVHKTYLVNFRCIKTINAKSIALKNDTEIPISRGKMIEIQNDFMHFLRNEDFE